MGEYSEAFVAFDVAKKKHAVAIAEGGRTGEIRLVGEVENSPAAIERTIKKLGKKYDRLHVCFEAGSTGYGLCRQVRDLGHDCMVVAPALIPKRPGERVKTNRRDAVTLARLHRAGELIVVCRTLVHEAVRDLVRAAKPPPTTCAANASSYFPSSCAMGGFTRTAVIGHWRTGRWLARQSFEQPRSRSCSRRRSTRSRTRLSDYTAWMSSCAPSRQPGPWVVEAYQPCAAPRSWSQ